MFPLASLFLIIALFATAILASEANDSPEELACAAENQSEVDEEQMYTNLIEFVRSGDGFVNPSLVVRPVEPNASFRGVFTTDSVREGDVLCSLPWHLILKAEDVDEIREEELTICRTIRSVIREMKLGEDSEFAPYVRYLLSTPKVQLPSLWSADGRDLLMNIIGAENEHYIMNPLNRWLEDCEGGDDPLELQAAMLTLSRETWDLMIPFYDMHNHHNGHKLNTIIEIREGEKIEIRAARDIEKDEQVYESYNFCSECGGRSTGYGTTELLFDYGFVENYPQRWIIIDDVVEFDLDYTENGSHDELEVRWLTKHVPSKSDILKLNEEIEQLEALQSSSFSSFDNKVPHHEWEVTKQYLSALLVALKHAVEAAEGVEGSPTIVVSEDFDYEEEEEEEE
eukprot:CAMPEP_0195534912 /NCGR_PEP_ID=MMETSP0794_2-20130614/43287_1 /TAXON_ID=515487 /ORGANISM="Stephanopyxis turris, Strain CCMP 815" /LENGTH=397 /DNA_ID=CAMNT_0040667905 /DNA_START=147 /DNA_END=1337 /DNA_ORIENTATION=+